MTPTSSEPSELRFFRVISIVVAESGYLLTFVDEKGDPVETIATVDDRSGIRLVTYATPVMTHWNGTAESVRRIAQIVGLFHDTHTRRSPEE